MHFLCKRLVMSYWVLIHHLFDEMLSLWRLLFSMTLLHMCTHLSGQLCISLTFARHAISFFLLIVYTLFLFTAISCQIVIIVESLPQPLNHWCEFVTWYSYPDLCFQTSSYRMRFHRSIWYSCPIFPSPFVFLSWYSW